MADDKIEVSSKEKVIISNGASKATRLNQVVWITWWTGTALIVASWFGIVSNTIGWIGFSLALASSFISVMASKYWRFPK